MTLTSEPRPVLKWLLGFSIWTLIGLSFAGQFYVSSLKAGRPVSWVEAITWSLGDWYVWAVLSIPVLALARLFHLEEPFWLRNLTIHVAASAMVSFVYILIRAWIGQWQSRIPGMHVQFGEAFNPLLVKTFFFNLIIYWVIVSVAHAVDYYRQFRERELRTIELEKSLTRAKLMSLQMQLNPHFLFNTLHAISALMHQDVEAADRMIVRLSGLLRRALESSEAHEIPLREELDFLKQYLEIEQTRFGSRLKVHLDVSPETLNALVPNLLLQPLVENAIQHGIEPQAKPGEIGISARQSAGELILEVRDSGVGLAAESKDGVGLANTRSRLYQLYGKRHRFEMRNLSSGGVEVTAALPLKFSADVEAFPA